MNQPKRQAKTSGIRGTTLLELLLTLTLVAAFSLATLQGYASLQRDTEALVAMQRLQRSLNHGRSRAITTGESQKLCPSRDGSRCGGDWHEGILLLADSQSSAAGHSSEEADSEGDMDSLWWQDMTGLNGNITWRAFGSRAQLRLQYKGVVIAQNGSFLYCPHDKVHGSAARLIVNRTARGRVELNLSPQDLCQNS